MNYEEIIKSRNLATTFKGFPYIKVGHFYKLQFKDAKAIAYCANEDKFVIVAGSTLAFDCPEINNTTLDGGGEFNENESFLARADMAMEGDMAQIVNGRLDVFNDYDKANPLQTARAITGLDNIDPAELWQEVFA